ncbi:MAG TPA: NAD(P)-dependent oxidoreductase [Candidatus Acidoferrales bacterium]|jgi:dihydropyrimidine dehydrogenase (NAD+) subunit PreT|nr:NAD(P)-dependent oxidoreductase [Candidatus Acidoferrales bacterium]
MSAAELPVPRNLRQFPELHPALDSQSALAEANRCLYCFDAPCTAACPTHIDVPRFIKKIATGNLRGSAVTILDANILGLSCARVCPVDVLCEGSCVMLRYNKKPIEIGRLQRFAMDAFYDARLKAPLANAHASEASGPSRDRKGAVVEGSVLSRDRQGAVGRVACIGGGPASLSCAAELRRHGVPVTIFDNRPLPGGLNTYGVAEYKLRPSDSLREVDLVRGMGVEFRQAEVGGAVAEPGGAAPLNAVPLDAVTLNDLEKDFDFIFVGVGLGAMERLGIPGDQLPGVIDALRFIERYKTLPDFDVGRSVIVIGAGNTAIDAANAAVRLGAKDVQVFYRRTEKQMPAFPFEYDHSKVEGVRFHWLAQPVAVMEAHGRAAGVKFVRTNLGDPDATGRQHAQPIPGSEFEVACDMVVPALGQSRLTGWLGQSRGIALKAGSIVVDRPTGRSSNPKYYAGGDCVNGGREVVDAVADGKRAALAMVSKMAGAMQEAADG